MITIEAKGNFKKTNSYFEKLLNIAKLGELDKYGKRGVEALASMTPKDTGKTSSSWRYEIVRNDGNAKIIWSNDNVNKGVNIAVILQYGHGTRSGAYVEGQDYINPSIRPVFEEMLQDIRKEIRQ